MSTITVTTTLDVVNANDGVTSLREAIGAAASGDLIIFDPALNNQTITVRAEGAAVVSREIAFIDSSIADFESFLVGIRPGIEAVVLSAGRSAAAQIAEALLDRTGLDTVHIVAHGKPGEISFASGVLTLETLHRHAKDLAAIGEAIGDDGELLLWSCETAKGRQGTELVKSLERATGVKVAAATHIVGTADKGGSWELDAGVFPSVSAPLTAQAAASYAHILALVVDLNTTTAGTGDTSNYTENGGDTTLFGNATIQADVLNWIHEISVEGPGVISIASVPSGFTVTGNGTGHLSIRNDANLDTSVWISILNSIVWNDATNDNPPSSTTLSVWVLQRDLFNNPSSTTVTATINITAVNDAPTVVNTADSHTFFAQTATTLYNMFSISDVDDGVVTAELKTNNGFFWATVGNSGLSINGDGTATLTITGTVAQINAYFAEATTGTLFQQNVASAPSTIDIKLSVIDSGGGFASDTATINITGFQNDHASAVTDSITQSAAGDTLTVGNTIEIQAADFFDGGDGPDTIIISGAPGQLIDLSAAGTDASHGFHNYERISGTGSVTLNANQFGNGLISNSLVLDGSLTLTVNNASNLLASAWTVLGPSIITRINGTSGNDILHGSTVRNEITGGGGNDVLKGGASNDVMDGGTGIDRADLSAATSNLSLTLNGATDATLFANGVANDILRNIENVTGGSGHDTLTGDSLVNRLEGGAGNDVLKGGGANDVLDGGAGFDTVDISGAGPTNHLSLTLNGATNATLFVSGLATDTIRNIENVIGGAGNDTLTGDSLVNILNGGSGNDTLKGGGANDVLDGGAGIDTVDISGAGPTNHLNLTLNGANNATLFVSGVATDTIRNIENVIGGAGNDTLTGDGLDNLFRGGAGADTLNGAAGIDTADYSDKTAAVVLTLNGATNATVTVGGVAEDTIRNIENVIGGSGNDTLTGDSLNNRLEGGAGNDLLKGGGWSTATTPFSISDHLDGGAGIDTVDLSNRTDSFLLFLSGPDTAFFQGDPLALQYTIRNVENVIGGNGGCVIFGDTLANTLVGGIGRDGFRGGEGNDVLDGRAGVDWVDFTEKTAPVVLALNGSANATVTVGGVAEDTIRNIEDVSGGSGNDSLTGDSLANRLEGREGNDVLKGGGANDFLDGGDGIDTVDISGAGATNHLSLTLNGANNATLFVSGLADDTIVNIENVIGGAGNDTLTGDSLANTLQGGAGNDTLKGGGANDILDGGAGIDTVDISGAGPTSHLSLTLNGATNATLFVNGVATDTIRNIENVIGGSGNDTLTGDTLANRLDGGAGNDILAGKGGNDILTGAANADTFFFNAVLNVSTNIDHISDFAQEDTIQLDDAIFTEIATGTLTASAFLSEAGATAANDADDRIVYNNSTGDLYYDSDGLGGAAAIKFAVLDTQPFLSNADFFVV